MAGLGQQVPRAGNGLGILRSMGSPILFDGRGSQLNLGVANKWVDLFDLTGQKDRIFMGIQVYNASSSIPLYIAFPALRGSESSQLIIEPGAVADIDELTFGPGYIDPYVLSAASNYVRAMVPTGSGIAASATATYASNLADGNSFTLGSLTYVVKSAPGSATPSTGQVFVLLGATLAATLTNIKNAINANDQSVTASASATVLTVTANYTGTGMNTYVFVDVSTGGTFTGSGTLASGASGIVVDAIIW